MGITKVEAETTYVRISHYCACKKCCGKHATGHFASGHKVRVGGVAANRYPMGTILYIVELDRFVVVTDRTDPKYASRVDIYVRKHGDDVQIDYAHIKVIERGTWDRDKVHGVVSRGFSVRDKLARQRWYAVQAAKQKKQIQVVKTTPKKKHVQITKPAIATKSIVAPKKIIQKVIKPTKPTIEVPVKKPIVNTKVPILIATAIMGCYGMLGFSLKTRK